MRILVTNDDGINAPGLQCLEEIATELAGPEGEVWTVAPAFEQSGVGHAISYVHPTLISKLGPRRFAAEGHPADCVLAGIYHVMKDARPDLVLSGVNRGNNSGENAMYSGTLGAAMEGALQGLKSVALSQYLGPENWQADDQFAAARAHAVPILKRLLADGEWDEDDYRLFYNINFPPVPAEKVKGTRIAPQGWRHGRGFSLRADQSPSGRRFLWIEGGDQAAKASDGTDVALNMEGYTSVTPMRADLTDHAATDRLRDLFTD